MAKKGSSSSTRASQTPVKNVDVKKDKSCSKTFGSEIDEIFSSKKRKMSEMVGKVAESNVVSVSKMTKKRKKTVAANKGSKDIKGPLDVPSGQRKRTKDGLVIYTEEELGFGKSDAGGTRLCPFDCDCCF
ncbi:hypothetical protein AgCh_026580 [Apium graveolens]